MVKQFGTVLFSNIVTQPTFNNAPTGKYELTLTLDDGQYADAEGNGLGVSASEYQGTAQYKIKCKTKFKLDKSCVVDGARQPFVDAEGNLKEIPRGSRVVAFLDPKPYTMMGKTGITNYLRAIQVIESATAFEFEDYVGEGVMDEGMEDNGEY